MQVTELSLPSKTKKITYEISTEGEVVAVKSEVERRENMFSQLFGKW